MTAGELVGTATRGTRGTVWVRLTGSPPAPYRAGDLHPVPAAEVRPVAGQPGLVTFRPGR